MTPTDTPDWASRFAERMSRVHASEIRELLSVKESGAEPKRAIDSEFQIDYDKRVGNYTDRVRHERSQSVPIPEGPDPIDLISALVQSPQLCRKSNSVPSLSKITALR